MENLLFHRVFLFSLSGLGAGAMPDAKLYHCSNANTLRSLFQTGKLRIAQLQRLGIGQIQGLSFLGGNNYSSSIIAKIAQRSENKDRVTGLNELLGIISAKSKPVYTDGLPSELIGKIENAVQYKTIGNVQCSKLDALTEYGLQHCETKALILFTSSDGTLSIAGHMSVISPEHLNETAEIIRDIMHVNHAVENIVSIPFAGKWPYYTIAPGGMTLSYDTYQPNLLDALSAQGFDVFSADAFASVNNRYVYQDSHCSLDDAMHFASDMSLKEFHGLCFVAFSSFEERYGLLHDADGFTQCLNRFDDWLATFIPNLQSNDLMIITSDGGCDPNNTFLNERTREYVPVILYGKRTAPANLGVRIGTCDIAATVASCLGAKYDLSGTSML